MVFVIWISQLIYTRLEVKIRLQFSGRHCQDSGVNTLLQIIVQHIKVINLNQRNTYTFSTSTVQWSCSLDTLLSHCKPIIHIKYLISSFAISCLSSISPLPQCHTTTSMSHHYLNVTPLPQCHPTTSMSHHYLNVTPLPQCHTTTSMSHHYLNVTPLPQCHTTTSMSHQLPQCHPSY